MSQDAMNIWHSHHVSLVADDSDNEVTLVRRALPGSATFRREIDERDMVELGPEDVFDDEVQAASSGVFSVLDEAFLAAVCDGPAIFGLETQRKLQKIVDQMREVDFISPGGRGACERHVLEARLRLRLEEAVRFDSNW